MWTMHTYNTSPTHSCERPGAHLAACCPSPTSERSPAPCCWGQAHWAHPRGPRPARPPPDPQRAASAGRAEARSPPHARSAAFGAGRRDLAAPPLGPHRPTAAGPSSACLSRPAATTARPPRLRPRRRRPAQRHGPGAHGVGSAPGEDAGTRQRSRRARWRPPLAARRAPSYDRGFPRRAGWVAEAAMRAPRRWRREGSWVSPRFQRSLKILSNPTALLNAPTHPRKARPARRSPSRAVAAGLAPCRIRRATSWRRHIFDARHDFP